MTHPFSEGRFQRIFTRRFSAVRASKSVQL